MSHRFKFVALAGALALVGAGCQSYTKTKVEVPAPKEESPLSIVLIEAPTEVVPGATFTVAWKVDAKEPVLVPHTAVHWDTVSRAGEFGAEVTPAASNYTRLTEKYASGSFPVPETFKVEIVAPKQEGALYLRAHTTYEQKHYWTDEMMVAVKAKTAEEKPAAKTETKTPAVVTIQMTADGFSPGTVTVKAGTKVQFKNADTRPRWPASAAHPLHTDLPGFDAIGGVALGAVYEFTFTKAGTWRFHDHLYPTMYGKVIVE